MMAANSVSSGVSCVPPPCGRTLDGGISGFAISHSPSGTIQLHVPRPMPGSTTPHHVGHGLSEGVDLPDPLHHRVQMIDAPLGGFTLGGQVEGAGRLGEEGGAVLAEGAR